MNKSSFALCVLLHFCCFAGFDDGDDRKWGDVQELNIAQFSKNHGPKDYLLSYPKSGNTWMRYCIEYLTKRPTLEQPNGNKILLLNCPLNFFFDLEVDYQKKPIWKVHNLKVPWIKPKEESLLLIVRNPKEVFVRHLEDNITPEKLEIRPAIHYFWNLEMYDNWRSDKRLLIYYEDFIKDPRATLARVVNFYNADPGILAKFMRNYDKHKKESVKFYDFHMVSYTQGQTSTYHSLKLSKQDRRAIDDYIKTNYPIIWSKYLKDRYAEVDN